MKQKSEVPEITYTSLISSHLRGRKCPTTNTSSINRNIVDSVVAGGSGQRQEDIVGITIDSGRSQRAKTLEPDTQVCQGEGGEEVQWVSTLSPQGSVN